MKPDFMDRIEKIIAEVRTRTCIYKVDTEVIEDILQAKLVEYYNEAYTYGHIIGYDVGYDEGYDYGLEDGRAEA